MVSVRPLANRAWVIGGLIAVCLFTSAYAAPLKLHLDRLQLALGEPLTLTLAGQQLEQLDLAPLSQDFFLHSRTLNRDGNHETLTLTLYPLRLGHLPLALPGTNRLAVTVGATSEQTPQVRFRIETDPVAPIQRQPTRLTLEACDDGSLTWQRPVLPPHPALFIRPLGETQNEEERDAVRCTAHRWHWTVTPTQAGDIRIALPMLQAGKLGQTLRYPAPIVRFQASPVPAWLPLNVAIGQPILENTPPPKTWPVERPIAWRLRITGGYSAEGLKALLAPQLPEGHAPIVEYLATPDTPASPEPASTFAVTLILTPETSGSFTLPNLSFPWFDPNSGRLEYLRQAGGTVTIFDPAWQRWKAWLTGLAGSAVLASLAWLAGRRIAWRLVRRRGLAAIRAAGDRDALAHALRTFSLSSRVPAAASLGIWRKHMQAETRCDGLDELVEAVQRDRYGAAPGDLDALKVQVARALRTARPR